MRPPMPANPVRRRHGADHRRTLEGIAWKYRTCSPWRELPAELGSFQTAHKRLIRWAIDGMWERIFGAVLSAADASDDIGRTVSVDSTVCRAHHHAAGAGGNAAADRPEPADHALGRSRGGLSTKVHLASDDQAHTGRHPAACRPARPPPTARQPRRAATWIRSGGLQEAECRRAVHQPPRTVARSSHANRQTRHRLAGCTAPCCHPHLDSDVSKETRPKACCRRLCGGVLTLAAVLSDHAVRAWLCMWATAWAA